MPLLFYQGVFEEAATLQKLPKLNFLFVGYATNKK
jgi:hypothetical protein